MGDSLGFRCAAARQFSRSVGHRAPPSEFPRHEASAQGSRGVAAETCCSRSWQKHCRTPGYRQAGAPRRESHRKGVAYALTIWKFGRLFDVLTIFRTVFGMVFGLSARSRGGIRAGLAKWATVGALLFAVVTAQAAASPFR